MITGDPKRTPTFTMFGNPDFWLSSGAARDALVARMRTILLGAAFGSHPAGLSQTGSLIARGERLLGKAALLASWPRL